MATESTRVDVRSRRSWPVAEKERIVAAYRAADTPTGRGEVMRREGVYQSLVWRWGQQIDAGTLGTKRPGPKATGKDKAKIRVRELEAQLERAKDRNRALEELVVTQGKCLALHVDVSVHGSANSPKI